MRQNQALEALAADTTNTMALVDRAATSAELRRAGFIYELQMVQGTEEEVSKWIPFPNGLETILLAEVPSAISSPCTNMYALLFNWTVTPASIVKVTPLSTMI